MIPNPKPETLNPKPLNSSPETIIKPPATKPSKAEEKTEFDVVLKEVPKDERVSSEALGSLGLRGFIGLREFIV